MLDQARVDGGIRVRDLTEPQVAKIREIIDRGIVLGQPESFGQNPATLLDRQTAAGAKATRLITVSPEMG